MLRCMVCSRSSTQSLLTFVFYRNVSSFRTAQAFDLSPKECWDLIQKPDIQKDNKEIAAALDRISKKHLDISVNSPDQVGLNHLINLVRRKSVAMKSRDLASVFVSVARMRYFEPNFWFTISERAKMIVNDFDTRSICYVFDSLARNGNIDRVLAANLSAVAAIKCADFTSLETAVMFSAVVKLHINSRHLIAGLCANVKRDITEFSAGNFSWILNALVKLKFKDEKLLLLICNEIKKNSSKYSRDFTSQLIGVCMNAFSAFNYKDDEILYFFCSLLQQDSENVSPQNISHTLHALSKFKSREVGRTTAAHLCVRALAKANEFKAIDISATLNAMAQMEIYDKDLVRALCKKALTQKVFSPCDIGNLLRALARFDARNHAQISSHLYDHLCRIALEHVKKFNSQEISNTLKALASLRIRDKQITLISQLCARALQIAQEFSPQDLGNVIKSLADLRIEHKELYTRLCMECIETEKLSVLTPRDIANIFVGISFFYSIDASVYAFPSLVSLLFLVTKERITGFSCGEITRLLHSLQILSSSSSKNSKSKQGKKLNDHSNHEKKKLIEMYFSNIIFSKAPDFTVSQITSILTTLTYFNIYDVLLVTRLCVEVLLKSAEFTPTSASDIMQALADFNVYDEALIKRLWELRFKYSPAGLVKALYSTAVFNSKDIDHISHLCSQIPVNIKDFDARQTIQSLFALCSLGHFDRESLIVLKQRLLEFGLDSVPEGLADEYCQAFLCLSLQQSDLALPRLDCYPSLPTNSEFSLQVGEALSCLDITYVHPHVLTGVTMDFALEDAKIVIQLTDISQYFRHSQKLRGAVEFKHRLLSSVGWTIIDIPHFQWSELDTAALRQAYLTDRLNQVRENTKNYTLT